jgi:hypothetical protein
MDTDTAALIVEAFDAGHAMPPHERLVELDKLLRAEIDGLVTYVQRLADKTAHRTREWYAMTNAIEKATDALAFQLGTGPLAGALHVAELARRIRELQNVLREVGGVQP